MNERKKVLLFFVLNGKMLLIMGKLELQTMTKVRMKTISFSFFSSVE